LVISNPTHKAKTGTANRWETTNSKPLGQIIIIDQSKLWSNNHIIFTILFSGKHAFYQAPQTLQKYFANFAFFQSNFNLQGHILSTAGVALSYFSHVNPYRSIDPGDHIALA
jgi:hypothetical protein